MAEFNPAKRGDFVVVDVEHVATMANTFERVISHSTIVGTVWNVSREGLVKTVRTTDGHIRPIGREKLTGYVAHHVVAAARIDVARAVEVSRGLETVDAVREAVRPFLKTAPSVARKPSGSDR